jgi:putative toxin-antitoxin system antitoxin component (TIGR02293 family)
MRAHGAALTTPLFPSDVFEVAELFEQWARVRACLKTLVGEAEYRKWVEQADFAGLSGSVVTITLPNSSALDWVSRNYGELIRDLWQVQNPDICRIELRTQAKKAIASHRGERFNVNPVMGGRSELHAADSGSTRGPRLTFKTFLADLRARLDSGTVAELHPTTLDLRLSILQAKADVADVDGPKKVLVFPAQNLPSDIRNLEDALSCLVAYANLFDCQITLETAEAVMGVDWGARRNRRNAVSLIANRDPELLDNGPVGPIPSDAVEDADLSLPEAERLALLDSINGPASGIGTDPLAIFEKKVFDQTVELLGGETVLGRSVRSDEELLSALTAGFPAGVLRSLQEAGYPRAVLERIIAPRRTLMRRRAKNQRLTRAESDAAWRLAHVLCLSSNVLNGAKAALPWLMGTKTAFAGQSPIDLMETSVGAAHVEMLLKRLEWGDVA